MERIEIIHTPLANQDAQGAVGTVNIILKQGAQDIPNEIGIGMGYLEQNGPVGDATLFYTAGNDRLRMTLAGGVQKQRRNESKDTLTFDGAGAANGGLLALNERDYDQVNLTPRLDVTFNEHDSLILEPVYLRTVENRKDIKNTLAANQLSITKKDDEDRKRTRENKGLYGAWKHRFSEATQLTTSLDWQDAVEDTTRDARKYDAAGTLTETRQRTENVGMDIFKVGLSAATRQGEHALEFGIGHGREKRDEDNSDIKNSVVQPPAANRRFLVKEDVLSLYAQDSFSPLPGNQLTLGLRGERAETSTRNFLGATTGHSKTDLLPSLSFRQTLDDATDLRAGIAKTLRRPDLRELSSSMATASGTLAKPDIGGNPDATPESIIGIDIGIDRFNNDRQGLLSAKVFARGFRNKLENILAQEAGRWVSRPQNVGDGRMHGIELDVRLPLTAAGLKDVSVWSNLTAVRTRLDSQQTGESRRFLNQPDHTANLGIDWFVPTLATTLGAALNYSSGYQQRYLLADGSALANDLDATTRLDFSARTQLTPQTSLNISALNLLAGKEKQADTTFNTAGTITAVSNTVEPTYRSLYIRLSHLF